MSGTPTARGNKWSGEALPKRATKQLGVVGNDDVDEAAKGSVHGRGVIFGGNRRWKSAPIGEWSWGCHRGRRSRVELLRLHTDSQRIAASFRAA